MKSKTSTYVATGVLVVLLLLWMGSGLLVSNTDASIADAQDSEADANALMKVEVTEIFPAPMERKVTLQGQLHANRQLILRADTNGTIESLSVGRGAHVDSNDLIAKLTLDSRAAELKEAQARIRTAASEQAATRKLQKQGLQSQLKADRAQAALESARASLERVKLEILQTEIRAPFKGIVNRLPVELGQQIEKGTVIAELVDNSSFRVTASVAQQSVHAITLGQKVVVKLITGAELTGQISFISAVSDPATRSFELEATIENEDQQVAAGISASLIIPVEKLEAFFVSPSTIALSDTGDIGIKAVNADNRVEFHSIKLVLTNSSGAWVTGVLAGTRVITLGQGFVSEGQEVEAVLTESLNETKPVQTQNVELAEDSSADTSTDRAKP